MFQTVVNRRLRKFIFAFVFVLFGMVVVSVFAYFDTVEHIHPENQWIVAQNLVLLVAMAILGIGTMAIALVRPTVKQIEELANHAAEIESGNLDTGVTTAANDELGSLYASMNSMRETIKARIIEVETQREQALAAKQESSELAEQLETRTTQYASTMSQTAAGDLTARLSVSEDDPTSLQRIARSFNETVDELQQLILTATEFTDRVVNASESSADLIGESMSGAQQASNEMDEIATDAKNQHETLGDTARELDTMSANIEEVAASTDELASPSKQSAKLTEQGRDDATAAVEELRRIETRSQSAVETISNLETQMGEIEQIVTTITAIAEQTHMLALNASIEAARAGQQSGTNIGNEFDVVANEVKALAEETHDSAGEIEAMIENLWELTETTAADMRTIQSDVKAGVETVESVNTALTDIDAQVAEVDDGIQQITIAMDEQARSLSDVTATVEDLTAFSSTTMEKTVSFSTELNNQVHTLTAASENTTALLASSEKLQSSLSMFTTSDMEQADLTNEEGT